MRRDKWRPTTNTVLCSKHFADEDFEPESEHRQKRDLRKTAVPTIFDYPEHLQPKRPKLRKPPCDRSLASLSTPSCQEDEEEEEPQAAEGQNELIKMAAEHDHDYSVPSALVLKQKLERAQEEIDALKVKLVAEQKKTSFQKKRNLNLKSTIESLKSTGLLEAGATDHLRSLLTPTLQELFDRVESSTTTQTSRMFPPELRVFASTLHFYSPKAYDFVRQTFNKALPHESTIRKWFSNISGSPGFSTAAFELLKEKVMEGRESGKPVLVSVMLDEMSLKRHIDYDPTTSSYSGYVSIGEGLSEEGQKPATDALVIMVVGINWHFKIPVAYFFIAGNALYTMLGICLEGK